MLIDATPPRPLPRHLLGRLQRDWDHLSRSRRAVATANGWALRSAPFESLDDVLAATGYGMVGTPDPAADRVLAELVRTARGDELAARVVLQRLLPGVSALARRTWAGGVLDIDPVDELVAAAWTVIRTFPIERCTAHVAAAMLRTIHYQTVLRPLRRQATFVPTPSFVFDELAAAEPAGDAGAELGELLDMAARAGVAECDIELARRLGRGETTEEIGRGASVTSRTVRNHRAIVAHRLRQVALAAG